MIIKGKIISVKNRPFQSSEGGMIDYHWYKIEKEDGITIELGSRESYSQGEEVEIPNVEKTELANGKFRYKQLSVEA